MTWSSIWPGLPSLSAGPRRIKISSGAAGFSLPGISWRPWPRPRARQTKLLLSTSAIGYYGDQGDNELTEESPPGQDFLGDLAQEWEAEALKAQDLAYGWRLPGLGLSWAAAAVFWENWCRCLSLLSGGPLGSGRQWFSWIDQSDLLRAFIFVLEHPSLEGPINFTAPEPVRNAELAKALGKVLHRPSLHAGPGFHGQDGDGRICRIQFWAAKKCCRQSF